MELPQGMQRAMARQAEAERERRAKIINAEGEFQAAERLAQAGAIIAATPTTLQLRFLQTLVGDRHGEEQHDHLPGADRHNPGLHREGWRSRDA